MTYIIFDHDHLFTGHVDEHLNHFDANHSHTGTSAEFGDGLQHFDANHHLQGSTQHILDTDHHYDASHRLVGTSRTLGSTTFHYDAAHQLLGSEQHFGMGEGGQLSVSHDAAGQHLGSMSSASPLSELHEQMVRDFFSVF